MYTPNVMKLQNTKESKKNEEHEHILSRTEWEGCRSYFSDCQLLSIALNLSRPQIDSVWSSSIWVMAYLLYVPRFCWNAQRSKFCFATLFSGTIVHLLVSLMLHILKLQSDAALVKKINLILPVCTLPSYWHDTQENCKAKKEINKDREERSRQKW
jgi:hypothetical protein